MPASAHCAADAQCARARASSGCVLLGVAAAAAAAVLLRAPRHVVTSAPNVSPPRTLNVNHHKTASMGGVGRWPQGNSTAEPRPIRAC